MTVKDRIKAACKERGISVNQLEKECGFGKGYISKLSDSSASISKICDIASYLHVSVDYLVDSEFSPFNDGEMRMVLDFRELTNANKQTILDNIAFLLEKQAKEKKESASSQ